MTDTGAPSILPGPSSLTFMLSWTCNADCPHCYARAESRPAVRRLPSFGSDRIPHRNMDVATFREVIDRYPTVRYVDLASLGETLLYPHFHEVFDISRAKFDAVGATTNGELLDRFPEILDVPGCLTVSIDSLTTPRPGLTDAPWRNLREFAARPRHANRNINLNVVVSRVNVHECSALIDAAGAAGLTSISLLRAVHLEGTTVEANELPPDYPGMEEIISAGRARWPALMVVDFFRYFDGGLTIGDGAPCPWPSQMLLVSTDGTARPCCRIQGVDLGRFTADCDPFNHPDESRLRAQCAAGEWSEEFSACRVCYVRNGTGMRHTRSE